MACLKNSRVLCKEITKRVLGTKILEKKFSTRINYSATDEEKTQFKSFLPDLSKYLLNLADIGGQKHVKNHFEKCLQYNITTGQLGLIAIATYKAVANNLTEDNIRSASILGWTIELLHSSQKIFDDITNQADHRNGIPCWHKEIGMELGLMDVIVLENCSYMVLKKYLKNHEFYPDIMKEMHNFIYLRLKGGLQAYRHFNDYNLNLYNHINKNKIESFYVHPLKMGLFLAKQTDRHLFETAEDIGSAISYFTQIQEDFDDWNGKDGTDIEKNVCSWFVCKAKELGSKELVDKLGEKYGKKEHVKDVKKIYRELKLDEVFYKEKEKSLGKIKEKIGNVGHKGLQNVLENIVKSNF